MNLERVAVMRGVKIGLMAGGGDARSSDSMGLLAGMTVILSSLFSSNNMSSLEMLFRRIYCCYLVPENMKLLRTGGLSRCSFFLGAVNSAAGGGSSTASMLTRL